MSTNVFPSTGTKPKFDPTQKYEPVEKPIASKKPKFNPNQGYEEVNEVEQKMPAIAVKKKPVQLWDYGFEKTEQPELPKEDYSKPVTEKKVIESVKTVPGVEAQKGEAKEKTGQRFGQEIIKAQQHLFNELTSNDDVIERIIRNERGRVEGEAKTDEIMGAPRSDMPSVQNPMLQFDPRIQQDVRAADQPVSPEDIRQEQQKISTDEGRARNVLEYIGQFKPEKKNEIQSSLYKLDVTQRLAEDPNAEKRLPKIMQNAKELAKGNLIYDPRNGQLIKPENIFQSFKTAWKHKEQSYEDFEKFRNIENNEAIAMELDERMKNADPDEPTPITSGTLGALGGAFGGMPLKVYAAGAIGGLAGPGGAITAASGVGAREAFKLGWANEFQRSYYELRKQGASGFEAVEAARKQADNAANIDAIVGGVTGAIAARIPYRQMTAVNFSGGFRKAVVSALKGYGQVLSPAMKEGILAGGIAAGGESYKNELAKEAGINRDASENVLEVAEMNLLMPLAIGAISGAAKLSKPAYRHIMQGLHNIPEGVFNNALSEFVSRGNITEEQAASVKNQVQEYGKVDATLPENIAPEAKVEIRGLIERRNELETQLEKTDKAFHPEIKEKIKAIEEQITEKSKDRVKPDKEKAEIKSLIDEGISEGLPGFGGIMKDIAQNDPTGFMKFVADQALGRTETGAMSELGNAEYAAREAFGDGVVERAVKMFPLEPQKPKVTVSTPIIRNVRAKEGAIPEFDIQYQQGKPTGTLLQGKDLIAEGSESTVYRDGDTVIKVSEPYNDASTFNARVEDARIISEQLGDGSVELIGTYKSQNGTPNPIFRQKFIEGEKATPEQIDAYMESKGFQKKDGGWENDQYRFTDIDSDNAIVDANGQVHIIDAGVKKLKSTQDAVQIESAEGIPVREPSVNRGEMGEGVPKPEELAGESAQAESQATGQKEGVEGASLEMPDGFILTHEQLQNVAEEFGFEPVQPRKRKSDVQLFSDAKKEVNGWLKRGTYEKNIQSLLKKAGREEGLNDQENVVLSFHIASLREKLRGMDVNNPEYNTLLSELQYAKEVGQIARSEQGAALRTPTFRVNPITDIGEAMVAKKEANAVDELTPKQKEEVKGQVKKYKDASEKADNAIASLQEKVNTDRAGKEFEAVKKSTPRKKKSAEQYQAERKAAIEAAREALKKLRSGESGLGMSVIPVRELVAIAPHVKKILVSLAEEGIDNLSVAVKRIHDEFKGIIDGITEKDINDIIAGVYNERKQSKTELQQRLKDFQDEAKAINELTALESGPLPKSDVQQVKRNQRIKELRDQIKGIKEYDEMMSDKESSEAKTAEAERNRTLEKIKTLQAKLNLLQQDIIPEKTNRKTKPDSPEVTSLKKQIKAEEDRIRELGSDARKLMAIKKRNEKQKQEIENKIKRGEFSEPEKKVSLLEDPEIKRKYPELRKEALDAIAAREDAQHDFQLGLINDELKRRNLFEKGRDFGKQLIATSKAVLSGIDDSATFVQNYWNVITNPKEGGKAWIDHWADAFSDKRFKRELAALHSAPDWEIIKNSELDVLEPQSASAGKVEEAFENNLLAKLKFKVGDRNIDLWKNTGGIFERAFTSLGNNLRVNLFRKRMQQLMDQGKTFESHPQEFKDAARVINEMTGRGKQNKYVQLANPLITPIIWAPRMISSSLNQLGVADVVSYIGGKKIGTEGFYRKLTPAQRTYAIKQFGKGVGLGIAAMAAASFGGAEVDWDPRSVTFGNIKFGTKSYNMFGRYAPYVKSMVQFVSGERIKPGGEMQELDSGKFGAKTRFGVVGGFFRGKMTPFAGSMYDLVQGRNYFTNEEFGISDLPEALLQPMSIKELREGWEQDGSISLLTRFLPAFEGIKVSDERDFKKKTTQKSSKNKKSSKSTRNKRKNPRTQNN